MKKPHKAFKWVGIVIASPIALFLFLAILIYIPPVQNFIVHRVSSTMSKKLGMNIQVERVRLAFPLDLAIQRMTAVERGDTLLHAQSLRLNVKLLPLFKGRADIEGFELYKLKLNTKGYIADTQIAGYAGEMTATANSINWKREQIHLNRIKLREADLYITLSDTAQKDTTRTHLQWQIEVEKADIERTKVHLKMPGDSMRIFADIGTATLRKGLFNLDKQHYAAHLFELRKSALQYDLPQQRPVKGVDRNHLSFSGISLCLDTLSYSANGTLKVGLRGLTLKEKCGLHVKQLSGALCMDSTRIRLSKFKLYTAASSIKADAALDFRAITPGHGGHGQVSATADIGMSDIRVLGQGYLPAALSHHLPNRILRLEIRANGNADHLNLGKMAASMSGVFQLKAQGYAANPYKAWRSGLINVDLHTQDLSLLRRSMPMSLRKSMQIPDGINAKGTLAFKGNVYDTHLTIGCGGGTLTAKAHADMSSDSYKMVARSHSFPINNFIKGVSVSPFSGMLQASGRGFDLLSPRASLSAKAQIGNLHYDKYDLSNTQLDATLRGGKAQIDFSSSSPMLSARGQFEGIIRKHSYELALNVDVPTANLQLLGISKDTLEAGTHLEVKAMTDKAFRRYSAQGSITRTHFTSPRMGTMAKDIFFDFTTAPDTTTANITAGDMRLSLGTKGDVPRLAKQLGELGNELKKQAAHKELDQERLKRFMPVMTLHLDAGRSNPLYNIARLKGYSFHSAHININTDPLHGMTGHTRLGTIKIGGLLLDSVYTHLLQDSTGIQLYGLVKNGRTNPVPMEVRLKSYVLATGAGIELTYLDEKGHKGVDLGLQAQIAEEGIDIRLYPEHPIIAYRNFTVNQDNHLFVGKDKRISANIDLLADDGTGLKLYGEPKDSLNDLTLSINQVNLGELSAVLPYLPQMGGLLSGDIHVTEEMQDAGRKNFSAMASASAKGFEYEGVALGDLGIDAIYLPKGNGEHHASAFISSNGTEVLACNGTYNGNGEGSFEGDARLHDFPLQLLNGFMAGTDVSLKGIAAGDINVQQTAKGKPLLNGSLDLDSAHIYSDVYGFDFRTDERAVKITDSRLQFKEYNLYSTGKEPLVLDGTFDMSDFSNMQMDFLMRAHNFELVNTRKKARSMVYGKVYANYLGTLKGTTDNLTIRGKLEVLDRTDMTYILKDSPLSVDDRLSDLVEFVNFKDSLQKQKVKTAPEGSLDLALGISVSNAAQFHCNLSDDGQSYIDLEGGGDLVLRMTQQGDMRLTGRFTANSGEMKYALPVIPLKTFQLVQGSSVEFTGDAMNPTLNITAKERTKAIVTENDRQRSVAFDVGVVITKPLNNMGLEFTIEAPEDLSIQNQLASMSASQRAKAAVTMMATGMFMTDESMMSGSGFKANNALNAFLQSEIQSIAGSALKTIDINLGVENSTTNTGSSTTDYSFQFAKRFWGNRISVIVGGRVSTGAEAQNSAESFINNVSVEYRLDASATRYVKVFYDRNTQDPLEGLLTRTGAGLVLRRKTDRLGELFIFRKKKSTTPQENPAKR